MEAETLLQHPTTQVSPGCLLRILQGVQGWVDLAPDTCERITNGPVLCAVAVGVWCVGCWVSGVVVGTGWTQVAPQHHQVTKTATHLSTHGNQGMLCPSPRPDKKVSCLTLLLL
jgi:hypothetical protein